jgi:membrane protein implicated in regulation of membrane protease activity
MWSARVLAKYWALQFAGAAVVGGLLWIAASVFAWPTWIVWAGLGAWLIKDAILFPFVWRAYDSEDGAGSSLDICGARGIAVGDIDQRGRVRVAGELWSAELPAGAPRIAHGECVLVMERRGMTLVVARDASD